MHIFAIATLKSMTFISTSVFIVLNIIENVIHYSGGASRNGEHIDIFKQLNKKDWIKIFGVMIVFATLQGLFTTLIYHYFHKK